MKVLAVIGTSTDTPKVTESLVEYLTEQGEVGVLTRGDELPTSDGGQPPVQGHHSGERGEGSTSRYPREIQRTYQLSGGGGWVGGGDSLSISDALDELARTCDYAVVEGFRNVDLPTVLVGEQADEEDVSDGQSGEVLAHVTSSADLDVESVVAALADVDPYETLESLVARVKQSNDEDRAGAIATFTGRVRAKDDEDDDRTEFLEFERYDSVAAEKMATIREELEARDGVYEVRLHHKTGVVEAGEDIVFVVVLAGHREEAFQTVRDGINRLKDEVPLFKKEVTETDEFWVQTGELEQ